MLNLSKEFSFILGHCPNWDKANFCFILGLPTWGIWVATFSCGPRDQSPSIGRVDFGFDVMTLLPLHIRYDGTQRQKDVRRFVLLVSLLIFPASLVITPRIFCKSDITTKKDVARGIHPNLPFSFCYICSLKSFSIKHQVQVGLFTSPGQTEQQLQEPMPRKGRVTPEPGLFSAVLYPWPDELSCR